MIDPTPHWYGRSLLSTLLLPLSWLYCAVVRLRRLGLRLGWPRRQRLPVPVIVVGNLTVGGTGKTPLVLYLAELLLARGWTPAIITRGYGGQAESWPQRVGPRSDPRLVGDESVLLAQRSGCTLAAGPQRVATARLALQHGDCDILISDDGLQHYALQRDLEILLIDGDRGLGNGRCLPAGPLREPRSRLTTVDLVLYKGGSEPHPDQVMRLEPGAPVNLAAPERRGDIADFRGAPVLAVAGIGSPEAFFTLLEALGLEIERRPFPDHHDYSRTDVAAWAERTVIMTEKDAVKCAPFATAHHWYLPVEARLSAAGEALLLARLDALKTGPWARTAPLG